MSVKYDLVVIGGGSGGLAVANECGKNGLKCLLFDFIKPLGQKTTWGFGGTCLNVGCIPKKLFHYAGQLGAAAHKDFSSFGFSAFQTKCDFVAASKNIQDNIKRMSFSYRNGLRANGVNYINAYAALSDRPGFVRYLDTKTEQVKEIEATNVVVAVGTRPYIPNFKGMEHVITSDDLFWMKEDIGQKILVIGGGYIAVECAGFLNEMGKDVKMVLRSVLLSSFDRQVAELLETQLVDRGIEIEKGLQVSEIIKKGERSFEVIFTNQKSEKFDNVLYATGRRTILGDLNLKKESVIENGKILVDLKTMKVKGYENVYGLGDCVEGPPELTPVAIRDGVALAKHLLDPLKTPFEPCDYSLVPTTVYGPVEYAKAGLSEEEALKKFEKVDAYLYQWQSLEMTVAKREKSHKVINTSKEVAYGDDQLGPECFAKVVVSGEDEVVRGIHYVGQNAGDVMQGFAVLLQLGDQFKKALLDKTIGIHPTNAEAFVSMLEVKKSSGEDFVAKGGCAGGRCG